MDCRTVLAAEGVVYGPVLRAVAARDEEVAVLIVGRCAEAVDDSLEDVIAEKGGTGTRVEQDGLRVTLRRELVDLAVSVGESDRRQRDEEFRDSTVFLLQRQRDEVAGVFGWVDSAEDDRPRRLLQGVQVDAVCFALGHLLRHHRVHDGAIGALPWDVGFVCVVAQAYHAVSVCACLCEAELNVGQSAAACDGEEVHAPVACVRVAGTGVGYVEPALRDFFVRAGRGGVELAW